MHPPFQILDPLLSYVHVNIIMAASYSSYFHADINECLLPDLQNCTSSEVCVNIVGSFRCNCVEGYERIYGGSCEGM